MMRALDTDGIELTLFRQGQNLCIASFSDVQKLDTFPFSFPSAGLEEDLDLTDGLTPVDLEEQQEGSYCSFHDAYSRNSVYLSMTSLASSE